MEKEKSTARSSTVMVHDTEKFRSVLWSLTKEKRQILASPQDIRGRGRLSLLQMRTFQKDILRPSAVGVRL